MRAKILLRDGTYLEGNIYKDSQLQNQLTTRDAIGEHFNRVYNRVYLASECIKAEFSTKDIDFWELLDNKFRGWENGRAR